MNTGMIVSKPKPIKPPKGKGKPVSSESLRGKLIKQAHAVMREIVIARDSACVCPPPKNGHSSTLQAGHVIRSTKGAVRFDLFNVHCQCSSCNGRHVNYEKYYTSWFVEKFGGAEYVRLCKLSDGTGLKTYELSELIVQLKLIRERQVADQEKEFRPYFTQAEILSGAWETKETK